MVDYGFRILCASEQSYSPKEAQPSVQICHSPASHAVVVA